MCRHTSSTSCERRWRKRGRVVSKAQSSWPAVLARGWVSVHFPLTHNNPKVDLLPVPIHDSLK